jgi:hypothetical protein
MKDKMQKLVETWQDLLALSNPPLENKYPIIEKNYLFYKLMEYFHFPFLQKEIIENEILRFHFPKV